MLNLRNEELAQLTQQYLRRMEAADVPPTTFKREKSSQSLDKPRLPQYSGSASSSTLNDEAEHKVIRIAKPDTLEVPASSFRPPKFLKWSGKASREHLAKEPAINIVPPEAMPSKPRSTKEHTFQQFSALRIARCDHCGDKMWGSHLRCTGRRLGFISVAPITDRTQVATCPSTRSASLMFTHPVLRLVAETNQLLTLVRFVRPFLFYLALQFVLIRDFHAAPSMFGRDLIEQVRADAKGEERYVPVIVEKCINAVDALGELLSPFNTFLGL